MTGAILMKSADLRKQTALAGLTQWRKITAYATVPFVTFVLFWLKMHKRHHPKKETAEAVS